MSNRNTTERGQVGVGTLIVFIAMVLVAAIASGVLINAAGLLQTKSAQASEESSDQVSNRIQIFNAIGTDINDSQEDVGAVNLTVGLSPSASEVDLSQATVQWTGPSGTFSLTHNTTTDGDGNFYVTQIRDPDDTSPVLSARDVRLEMSFRPRADSWGSAIPAGSTVELRITTQSGATTIVVLNVPQAVAGENAVRL